MREKEDTGRLYFLFEHAAELDANGIELAGRAGVPAVVSISVGHYPGQDHMRPPTPNIVRLRDSAWRTFRSTLSTIGGSAERSGLAFALKASS